MPELPEVETVVRGLNKHLVGHTIKSFDFDWPKTIKTPPEIFKKN
jgi:formamidopyrimidine-DNA glycosylase